MASWSAFAAADPELAATGKALLFRLGDGIGLCATVRHDDGGPRVHPVCLTEANGNLYLAIPTRSPKNHDLRVDPRFMLHAFPADEDAEFSIRGATHLVTDIDERWVVAEAADYATGLRDDEDVFRLDITRADSTTWLNWNTADTTPVRQRWVESP